MGATISTAKRASAFRGQDGKIYYALFEETYEANVHPHTPYWSCTGFGDIERTIKRIFLYGASCEGGMLRVKGGRTTPSAYISAWLDELASPTELPDKTIALQISKDFSATIPLADQDKVISALENLGRVDIAQQLLDGKAVNISLHQEPQLVQTIYGFGILSAWRVMDRRPTSVACPELGYSPTSVGSIRTTVPRFMKLDDDIRLQLQEDGTWRNAGWEYSVIGQFVGTLADVELSYPGTYKARITAFRKAMSQAEKLPQGSTVIVDLSVPLESKYADERRRKLVEEHADRLGIRKTDRGYELAFPEDREDAYRLTSLPPECVRWVIPEPHAEQLKLAA